MVDVVATARSNYAQFESPCLKTSDEEFLKRIFDLRDCCMESAYSAERTDWINVRRINSVAILH